MTNDPLQPATAQHDAETESAVWLTVPDLVDLLGEPVGRIHRLLQEHHLPGTRRNGPVQVPAGCVQDGAPISALRGTLLVLLDQGLTEDEAIDWLLAEDRMLGMTPIEALRTGGKSSVRRAAQTIG